MLNILHQDHDLLILNKPSGLLCVPGLSDPDNLFDQARAHYPNIRVVHRLDMATSGIILFALNHQTQKHLGQQFEQRAIKKRYIAIVEGLVQANYGDIVAPLICDWDRRPRQKIDWSCGKPAHTVFRLRQAFSNCSELELYPITGRSHQLRVHCQSIGHPIIGDQLYNVTSTHTRMLLHAERITFIHPRTMKPMEIISTTPFSGTVHTRSPQPPTDF